MQVSHLFSNKRNSKDPQHSNSRRGLGPPQLLAKAESAENERRHEAEFRGLTHPGPKARRINERLCVTARSKGTGK